MSFTSIFSSLGSTLYIIMCEKAAERGLNYPFLVVATIDVILCIIVIILSSTGLFGGHKAASILAETDPRDEDKSDTPIDDALL